MGIRVVESDEWWPAMDSTVMYDGAFALGSAIIMRNDTWRCLYCGRLNDAKHRECSGCRAPKGAA